MRTVRDMYRSGGMNEYEKSGKMPPQLLEYFKEKGKARIKEYQNSGKYADDSRVQQMYDDASAIGMGLLNMLGGEGDLRERYEQGFHREMQADQARQRSGQAGMLDAAGAAVGGFFDELLAPGYEYKPASVQKHPIDAAGRAFDYARMTNEERDALRRARENR